MKVVGRTMCTDVDIAAHAKRENHYAVPCTLNENFLRFHLQVKHNASEIICPNKVALSRLQRYNKFLILTNIMSKDVLLNLHV